MRTALLLLAFAPAFASAQNASNPDCANAYPIAVSSGAVPDEWILSNTGDEPNAISPAACTGNGYNDVWFSFVATASTLTIVHDGRTVDAVCIEAFSGTCGTLNSIGCTAGPISNSALPLTGLVVGNTYYFRSFQTVPGGGNTRRWGVVHPITNNECAGAMELVPSPNSGPNSLGQQFTTVGATQSLPGCGVVGASDDDVWLHFTATATKHTAVIATDLAVVVEAYTGTCGSLTSLWCEDNWVLDGDLTGLTIGQDIYLRVYTESTVVQTYTWFSAGIGSPPANDECANAITISVNEGPEPGQVYGFNLATATSSAVNNYTTLEDVWYSFTAPSTNLVVEKVGSFSLALFDANCVDGITSEGVYIPLVLDALVPGTTYKLKAGSGTMEGLRTRGFTTNDDCADAINLPVQDEDAQLVYTHAVTYGATESATACVSGTDDDVWFTFTATAPTIHLSGLADGTALRYELNTGACGSLTAIECGGVDFNFGTVLDSLVIGTNYTFRLWTNNTEQKPLRVALTKTLANDECAGAVPLIPTTLEDFDYAQRTEFRFATSSLPQCGSAFGTMDLWYSFTATAPTAALVLQPHYTDYDLSSEIFSGTCASLTSILCTTELQTNHTGLVPGETYFVRIYTNAGGDSDSFNHQFYAPPANDDMAGAIELLPSGDAFVHPMKPFSNYGASMSFPQVACTGTPQNDVWFYFVATNTTHAVGADVGSIQYEETATTLRIETFRGFSTIPDTLLANELICGTNTNGINVTGLAVGDTVMVRFFSSTNSPHVIRTFHPWVGGSGTSDEASGAVTISDRDVYAVEFNTNNATQSLPSNGCGVIGDSPDDDVWFKFIHDGDAATITCHFLDNNAVLELFQGPVGSLTSIACGYNYLVLPGGMVDGQTYHLRVYSRNTSDLRGKLGIFHTPHPMESACADVDCLGPNLVLNPGIEPGELNATMFQAFGPPVPIGHGLAPHWHTAVATADSYSSGNDYADDEHLPEDLDGLTPDLASDVRPRGGGGAGGAFAHQSSDYYEALGGELSAPLVPGVPYLIAFNVRLRGNIGGCDGFGAHLSLGPIAASYPQFNPPMQIEWQGGPINVTNEWQTICGQIIADQPYEHITIGVLKPQDELDCAGGDPYYYFDDVTVAEIIDALCVTVDVEEVDPATSTPDAGDGLRVFPNPANDRLNISIEEGLIGEEAVIELFDVTGKCVQAQVVSSLSSNVVVELAAALREGLYLVMVRTEGWEPKSARVDPSPMTSTIVRMRPMTALLFIPFVFGCGAPEQEPPEYTLPAEWEPHEAVWFTYGGNSPDTVLDKVVLAMDPSTFVVCAADNDSLARTIAARWDSLGIARTRYRMEPLSDSLEAPTVRDGGPIFLRTRDGSLAVLDPDWNYYGDHTNMVGSSQAALAFEDSFPTMLARRLGLPVVHSDMVIEGGAVEVNGAGTLLQVEAVTMQRNPGWSRDSMEHELKRVFGVRDIIWLKEGPADDMWYMEPRIHDDVFNQGTGGHVDEFCRFVNDSTVLLAWPDDADLSDSAQAITRQSMEVNLRILEQFRDGKGRPLRVVKVPTPDTEFHAHAMDTARSYDRMLFKKYTDLHVGDTIRYIPAASYLNLLITNGRVFAPAYWHEGLPTSMKEKDERVLAVLKKHFPNRTIVQVDPRAINWRGGGVHCWTQQQPTVLRR